MRTQWIWGGWKGGVVPTNPCFCFFAKWEQGHDHTFQVSLGAFQRVHDMFWYTVGYCIAVALAILFFCVENQRIVVVIFKCIIKIS